MISFNGNIFDLQNARTITETMPSATHGPTKDSASQTLDSCTQDAESPAWDADGKCHVSYFILDSFSSEFRF